MWIQLGGSNLLSIIRSFDQYAVMLTNPLHCHIFCYMLDQNQQLVEVHDTMNPFKHQESFDRNEHVTSLGLLVR